MRTAFLGSYGFGNLGDELCLIESLKRFGTEENWVFSVRPEFTGRFVRPQGWFSKRKELLEVAPDRLVLGGGGVGFWPSIRDSLHWMHDHVARGVECHIHNIGVGKITEPEWKGDHVAKEVVSACASFTVRDHISRWMVLEWQFGRDPGLTFYPERELPADMSLVEMLPTGPLLGISITGQEAMTGALKNNYERVRLMLRAFENYKVVPIISVNHPWDVDEDDIAGFERFADVFLRDHEIVLPECLDRSWWTQNLTPLNLKGLISSCDMLISQRKHNIIHAVGAGVPFVALHPATDDSLERIIYSLREFIVPACSFLSLP